MTETMRKSAFARRHGVSAARVSQWVSTGLIDGAAIVGTGRAARIVVSIANEQLRGRLDQARRHAPAPEGEDAAPTSGSTSDALADPEFTSKRAEREELQAELIKLRLARAKGLLIPRAAALEAAESAGLAVARSWQALPTWAEEIFVVIQQGGLPAITAWLRAKASEQCAQIADLMAPLHADGDDDDDAP